MRVLVSLLAAFAAFGQNQPQAPAKDNWPQFRGNPSLTGITASTLPAKLKLLWTFDAGDTVESSAAIVDGAVYFGSGAGELIALNLSDGKVRWRYKTKEGVGESSPAVGQGIVVIGDLSGVVHAVNAADGKGLWTFMAGSEIKASPAIVGDRVVIGSYDGNLYGLALKDGKALWKVKTNGPVHATACVYAGLAYVSGCDGVLRGVRVTDGVAMNEIKTGSYTGASPLFNGTSVYFGTFNNDVLAYNVKSKAQLWRFAPRREFPFYSSATLFEGKVILGGRDKVVHALDEKTGKEAWEFPTKARVESSPAVSGGRIYVGSNDGNLYVLDGKTGKKLDEFTAGSPLSTSPAISQGRLVIGSQDGKIYCLGG